MNWRRGRNNSRPGTGGVARRAGVVVKSKWFSLNGAESYSIHLPPRRCAPPLLFQEGSCSSLSYDFAYKGVRVGRGVGVDPSSAVLYVVQKRRQVQTAMKTARAIIVQLAFVV